MSASCKHPHGVHLPIELFVEAGLDLDACLHRLGIIPTEECPDDATHAHAQLPSGWQSDFDLTGLAQFLLDQRERIRVVISCVGGSWQLELATFYGISVNMEPPDRVWSIIENANGAVLRRTHIVVPPCSPDSTAWAFTQHICRQRQLDWLRLHKGVEDPENPFLYWD